MTPKVLQCLVYFLHFNAIKNKRPHSKTLEVPSLAGTGGLIPFYFKELKCYLIFGFKIITPTEHPTIDVLHILEAFMLESETGFVRTET
jgi:hypothetical protein